MKKLEIGNIAHFEATETLPEAWLITFVNTTDIGGGIRTKQNYGSLYSETEPSVKAGEFLELPEHTLVPVTYTNKKGNTVTVTNIKIA